MRMHCQCLTLRGITANKLGRLGNQIVDNFEKMVRANHIQNCPNTSKGMANTKVIFGHHLVGVRVKTVRRTPKWVDSDRIEIPREFQLLHKSITFVADIFFVNGITFFITLSRKIRFLAVNTYAIYDC